MQHHQQSLKREFLQKWVKRIQFCTSFKENMTLFERKKAIKLSADLAMASTRHGRSWSRAVISKASQDRETRNLAKKILDSDQPQCFSQDQANAMCIRKRETRRKLIRPSAKVVSRKMCNTRKCAPYIGCRKVKARSIAKRLVKKRTQILKELVPGGNLMDEYSLIKETLDYIVTLRAQVDGMNHLANSPQLLLHK